MKKLTFSILLLLFTFPILAQERVLEQVDNKLYEYTILNENGKMHQTGFYKMKDGTFFEHGIWKDEFGTKALFEMGKMVWIHPKGQKRYTFEEIQLHKLKRRIDRLEEKLTSL